MRLLPVLVVEVPHASQLLMDQGVADATHSNKISRDHVYYGDVTRDKILLQGGGRVGELLLKEFTNPTSATWLQQLQYNPLLGRACTSEWLRPRLQQHHKRPGDRQRR